jgi:phosphopantothenoylcysteine decarboxylase / phosphopantothenate---cysteine ligase
LPAELPCRRLLVGGCGSIHVTALAEYLVAFRTTFAESIRVILTGSAQEMVQPWTLELHLDQPAYTGLHGHLGSRSPHISLTEWAELFLVLPATANMLGKAANGIADDLLSTAVLASPQPVLFAPCMNSEMWNKPSVQRNVRTLREDGHHIIPPREVTAMGTGRYDTAMGQTIDTVMPHIWHHQMRRLRSAYWAEATATPAATPAASSLSLVSAS